MPNPNGTPTHGEHIREMISLIVPAVITVIILVVAVATGHMHVGSDNPGDQLPPATNPGFYIIWAIALGFVGVLLYSFVLVLFGIFVYEPVEWVIKWRRTRASQAEACS